MKDLQWCQKDDKQSPIIKVPLQFAFPPVEVLMKQLTRLNSPHPYRIVYLGPRWDNSLIFHKKYSNGGAYEFNERKVSKNTNFLQDSMVHNQFYKNEIYYRAFEGMNPTINITNQLVFQSRFEGGNLDCAVKISEQQYDLFLRIDTNTRGHIFWFYFSVRNLQKGKKVKFNLANLTKNDTHYTKGLNPFMYSSNTKQWTQEGMTNFTFKEKRLRYQFLYEKLKIRNFYQLSFQVQSQGEDELKFAYCIPYNYSDLQRDLKEISSVAEIQSLGYTLTGVKIPLVMIGKNQQNKTKPVLLITGRIHPGESNSSIIISKLLKYLCFSPQAKYMREKVITLVIPMANPDGVIFGNSRCAASGKDLNRQFKTNSKALFPEIVLLKNLVDKIQETHDIELYLDFHGHSRKKNMFIFGPSYNLTQPQYYKSRVFPKLLANYTTIFRYYSCTYDIPYEKRSTARAVMLNQLTVSYVFTVQTSLGFYHDYNTHKDMVFRKEKWEELGQCVILAAREYFQGLEQYQLYIQAKKKAKKNTAEQIKSNNANALMTNIQAATTVKKSLKEPKKQLKDIKMFKIFQQIKQLEDKRGKQQKKQRDSDNQSDSHDQKEELQKQKMHQFAGMVTQFVEQENKILQNQYEKIYINPKNVDNKEKLRKTRNQRKLQRQQRMKYQQSFIQEFSEQKKQVSKRFEVKTQSKNRSRVQSNQYMKKDRAQLISSEVKKRVEPVRKINFKQREKKFSLNQYLDEQVQFVSVQKKNSKMNIRMFNFSKMVQNPKSLRYQDHKQYLKAKEISHNFDETSFQQRVRSDFFSDFSNYSHHLQSELKSTYINLENVIGSSQASMQAKNTTDELKHLGKGKNGFPSSFYRIKYHNNQRKKMQIKKQKQLCQFQQYQKIHQYNTQHNISVFSNHHPHQKQANQDDEQIEQNTDNDGLFVKVKKFPVF